MNTPAHLALGLAALGRGRSRDAKLAVLTGAFLPDAPMFLFYAWQKLAGTPEMQIWRVEYFKPAWQNFIDCFNALPLLAGALLVAHLLRARLAGLLLASMVLHVLLDFPLHHDDGHRHFFPFSEFRYHSPISYWDPRYHGGIVSVVEVALVVLCCSVLLKTERDVFTRLLVGGLLVCYVGFFVFAAKIWGG